MVYVGKCACYENIKIKLWSTISILKPWHGNFSLLKENDCKIQLRFVKYCTLVVTEGYHILLSLLKILCRGCISWELAGNIISGKGSVMSVNRAGGSEPLRRGFKGQSPLRKFRP